MDKTVGVLGGGQLGRMFLEAANRLNIRTHVLADAEGAPAKQVSAHAGHVAGSVTNPVAVKHLAAGVDVLTVEIEHVDTEVLEEIAEAHGGGGDEGGRGSGSGNGNGNGNGSGNGNGGGRDGTGRRRARRESDNGHGKAALMSGGLGGLADTLSPTATGSSAHNNHGGGGSSRRKEPGGGTVSKTTTGASSSAAAHRCAVHPSWRTLRTIQDKFAQKVHLQAQGLPCARAVALDPHAAGGHGAAAAAAVERVVAADLHGFPAVLKARTGAYDGRGNYVLRHADDVPRGLDFLGRRPLYVEEWAGFVKELAVMVVKVDGRAASPSGRGRSGSGEEEGSGEWRDWTLAYPVVETVHEDGVCSVVYAPARDVEDKVRKRAQDVARRAVATFWGKGIFGVEMFLMPNSTPPPSLPLLPVRWP